MRVGMRAAMLAAMAMLGGVGGAGTAQALVIDFNDFTFNDSGIHDITAISGSLSRGGFTLTAEQFTKLDVFGTLEGRFAGQVAAFNNANTGATTLTRSSGGTFSFLSIDVANILNPGADSITFEGILHGGGTVTESFTFNSFGHLTTLTLDSDFQNLDSLSFDENSSPGFQFTNLVVTADAIPEPATVGLLAIGLVAFRFVRRRKPA